MNLLINISDLKNYKSRDLLPLKCYTCFNVFYREKHDVQKVLKHNKNLSLKFCSKLCNNKGQTTKVKLRCGLCSTVIYVMKHDVKEKNFCSRSCANKSRIIVKPLKQKRIKLPKTKCLGCPKILNYGNKTGMCKTCYLSSDKAMEQRGRTFSKSRKYKIHPTSKEKFYLMSSLEEKFFDLCLLHNINFTKPKPIKYLGLDNKLHTYFPDFLLPNENVIVEIKGFLTKEDEVKMNLVVKQNPELDIRLVFKEQIKTFVDKILASNECMSKTT